MTVTSIWDIITQIFTGIGEVWNWFTTPIDFLGGLEPWKICTATGFLIIIVFWIVKLVNPLS